MASRAIAGEASGRSRRPELLLILVFWTFAFAIGSVRGIVAGEIPFALIAPHRLAVMGFGALLCWIMIHLLETARQQGFTQRALLGLAGAGAMSALQSLFHMASCRISPIDGFPPISVPEAVNSGMVSFGYFVAWTWMHFALVAQLEGQGAARESLPPPRSGEERIFWASRGRQMVRIPARDLVWAEAQRDYVMLHAAGGGGMVRGTFASLEEALDPELFVRLHRSAIVRRSAIAAVRRKPSGAMAVTLATGEEVPVGRSYVPGLKALQRQLGTAG